MKTICEHGNCSTCGRYCRCRVIQTMSDYYVLTCIPAMTGSENTDFTHSITSGTPRGQWDHAALDDYWATIGS